MDLSHRRSAASRVTGISITVCLITSLAATSSADNERIVVRGATAAQIEEIRATLGATRVRTLPTGSEIWEVPAGTRAAALSRYAGDDRLAYIEPIDGAENQLFADRSVVGDLTPFQNQMIASLSSRNTTGALHTVALQSRRFTVELLQSPTADQQPVKLNLMPGQTFDAVRRSVETRTGGFTWFGDVQGDGEATLIIRGDNVTGHVIVAGKQYSIRPLGGGLHAVYEVKQEAFPPEHSSRFDATARAYKAMRDLPALLVRARTDTRIPIIDVMVVYPAALASSIVDLEGTLQLAIDVTNRSFQNSQVVAKLALVHHQAVAFQGTGKTDSDLTALESSEGGLAEVPALRDAKGADFVVLVVEHADFCGEAADIVASDHTAFAVVRLDCATDNLSFPHELGHLLGARHDLDTDPQLDPFKYGHGHLVGRKEREANEALGLMAWIASWFTTADESDVEDPVPVARTIMAYADGCGNCDRIPYWSTPKLEYEGKALGTEMLEDNARVLNQMAPVAAGFRSRGGP